MAPDDARRRMLLQFLDDRAFRPVLTMAPERVDRFEELEDAQARCDRLRRCYHERCPTAADVRRQFAADVASSCARLDRELDRLGLPTLPGIAPAFLQLCDQLGVDDDDRFAPTPGA